MHPCCLKITSSQVSNFRSRSLAKSLSVVGASLKTDIVGTNHVLHHGESGRRLTCPEDANQWHQIIKVLFEE